MSNVRLSWAEVKRRGSGNYRFWNMSGKRIGTSCLHMERDVGYHYYEGHPEGRSPTPWVKIGNSGEEQYADGYVYEPIADGRRQLVLLTEVKT